MRRGPRLPKPFGGARQADRPKAYAFIDSQNLNLGIQKMGWKMDWRKFREFLRKQHNVTNAYMFIGYMAENESLYEYMHELGFLVVLKPTLDMSLPPESSKGEGKDGSDGESNKPPIKGNIDADLVLHAMKELPNYDKAIIVSGDGDFFGLVEYLEQQGKLLHVMTPNWQYSNLLKPFEKYIIRLDTMRRQLSYHDRKKKRPAA